ncbi:MAG TPA: AI-2E family transporter [Fimbriimonadales bacterium]|nr:AI-2E family transporter [Fimbriimonadales bacterium]
MALPVEEERTREEPIYAAEKYRRVAFAILAGIVGVLALIVFLPFWQALAWGVALSIIVYPIYAHLKRKMPRMLAAILVTLLTASFLVLPLAVFGLALYGEARAFYIELQTNGATQGEPQIVQGLNRFNDSIQPFLAQFGIQDFDLKLALQRWIEPMIGGAPRFLANVVHVVLVFIFSLLLLFFILLDSNRLYEPALSLIPLPRAKSQALLTSIYDTVHATFFGVVLISIINGILVGLWFLLLDIPGAMWWGVVTALFSFIPIAGAPFVYLPVGAYLAYQGDWLRALLVIGFGLLIVSLTVDKIYRSFVVGSRSRLHPMVVFFSLLGGAFALGAVGTFIGPVVCIVALKLLDVLREINSPTEESVR